MNAINKLILKIVLWPSSIYNRLGVDVLQLKAILIIKLIMDDRRPNTFQQTNNNKSKSKPVKSATIGTMLQSAVLGLFYLSAFFVGNNNLTHLTLYFSMYLFLLASTLITDFTSVLMDVRDNNIILPKPVSDRTVVIARLLHITIHISKMVLPMSLPGLIYMWYTLNAWAALVMFIMIVLVTLFTIFLINAFYILILKITTPQKFQSVITYFQVFFAIFIFGGYQLVPRLINNITFQGFDITTNKWMWLLPTYWFAGSWQLLAGFNLQLQWMVATVLSVLIPLLSIWIIIKYFAPSFNKKLALISASSPNEAIAKNNKKSQTKTSSYPATAGKIFTQQGAERMSFLFCWKITARSKDFMMKVYPSFGYLLVYCIILFLKVDNFSLQAIHNQTLEGKKILVSIIYFSSFMLIMIVTQLAYSEKFKAAWIYFVTPIIQPGLLLSGALKSVLIKYYLPFILSITIMAFYFVGIKIVPNLLLGIVNQLLIYTVIASLTLKNIPFSASQDVATKTGSFIRVLFTMIIPAVLGFLHYLVYDYKLAVIIAALISILLLVLLMRRIKNTSWQRLTLAYQD